MADRLRAYGVPASRVTEMIYGVSPAKRVRSIKTPAESLRFAFLGSAEPIKGLDVLLRAVELLPDDLPLSIRAMGNEAVRDLIEQTSTRVRRYVRYHPPEFGRALDDAHAEIDAVLVPSLWHENSSLAVLESLANGTPVLAVDQAGISHLILEGQTGRLTEPGNPRAWARAFIDAVQHPTRIRRMQTNARFDRTTADFVNDVETPEARLIQHTPVSNTPRDRPLVGVYS